MMAGPKFPARVAMPSIMDVAWPNPKDSQGYVCLLQACLQDQLDKPWPATDFRTAFCRRVMVGPNQASPTTSMVK